MKLCITSIFNLALAANTVAATAIQPAHEPQPPPRYPIGTYGGSNAKVAGRLFDINGRIGYFAGNSSISLIPKGMLTFIKGRMHGGLHI